MFFSLKTNIKNVYDKKAPKYGILRNKQFDNFLNQDINKFADLVLKLGKEVIDLGSGPGWESIKLNETGLKSLCVDNSDVMIKECKKKKLKVRKMDFYHLDFPKESFYGVWMAFSLVHIPKNKANNIIKQIHRILKKNGILYISLFKGIGEGFRKSDYPLYGSMRYFSYYSVNEIRYLLQPFFYIIKIRHIRSSNKSTMSFHCIKKDK